MSASCPLRPVALSTCGKRLLPRTGWPILDTAVLRAAPPTGHEERVPTGPTIAVTHRAGVAPLRQVPEPPVGGRPVSPQGTGAPRGKRQQRRKRAPHGRPDTQLLAGPSHSCTCHRGFGPVPALCFSPGPRAPTLRAETPAAPRTGRLPSRWPPESPSAITLPSQSPLSVGVTAGCVLWTLTRAPSKQSFHRGFRSRGHTRVFSPDVLNFRTTDLRFLLCWLHQPGLAAGSEQDAPSQRLTLSHDRPRGLSHASLRHPPPRSAVSGGRQTPLAPATPWGTRRPCVSSSLLRPGHRESYKTKTGGWGEPDRKA